MDKPFTQVTFERNHPADPVADHEVLMSFVNDQDAEDFRNWWDDEAAVEFQKYRVKEGRRS